MLPTDQGWAGGRKGTGRHGVRQERGALALPLSAAGKPVPQGPTPGRRPSSNSWNLSGWEPWWAQPARAQTPPARTLLSPRPGPAQALPGPGAEARGEGPSPQLAHFTGCPEGGQPCARCVPASAAGAAAPARSGACTGVTAPQGCSGPGPAGGHDPLSRPAGPGEAGFGSARRWEPRGRGQRGGGAGRAPRAGRTRTRRRGSYKTRPGLLPETESGGHLQGVRPRVVPGSARGWGLGNRGPPSPPVCAKRAAAGGRGLGAPLSRRGAGLPGVKPPANP